MWKMEYLDAKLCVCSTETKERCIVVYILALYDIPEINEKNKSSTFIFENIYTKYVSL